ncbi:MAG: hypothetical protein WC166_04900 [Bacteroidales bacterium]
MEKKLNFTQTLTDGVKLGIANFVPLLLTTILYAITAWIPYLNVGTTIGYYKVILSIAKGNKIDPVSIFDKENFSRMGDFFIFLGLKFAGTGAALCFMLLPGIVMSIAWNYAIYIFLDKNEAPVKSLTLSYKITLGEKWKIFFIQFVFGICIGIVSGLFGLIPKVGVILSIIVGILAAAIYVAIEAVIYRQLITKLDPPKVEEPKEEPIA